MIIIKVYLLSVLFYFLLIEITGLIFKKRFVRNTNLISKILNDKTLQREGNLKTTLRYLIISFIPTIRLLVFIEKMILTFKPYIILQHILKEREKKNVNDKKI